MAVFKNLSVCITVFVTLMSCKSDSLRETAKPQLGAPTSSLQAPIHPISILLTPTLSPPSPTVPPVPTPLPTLSASPPNLQVIIPIEASIYDFYTDTQYLEFKNLTWEPNSSALRYAIGQHCSEEPKDWQWWRFNLKTNSKEQLPAPQSSVKEALRKSLNLRSNQASIECGQISYLFEAPSGTRFAYALQDTKTSKWKLWRSKVNGVGRVFLSDLNEAADIAWSPSEDWILIIKGIADVPIVDVVKADGSFIASLSSLVKPIPQRTWLEPRFSPDGKKIAYLGSSEANPEDYETWIVDLGTWKATQVSKHAGPLQWSADSQSIYILDQKPVSSAELEGRFDEKFSLDLYRVDLAGSPFQETLIANALPWRHTDIGNSDTVWAVSPDSTMVAYIGLDDEGMFGIVKIAPTR